MSDDLERRLAGLLDELPGPDRRLTRSARAGIVPRRPAWRRAVGPVVTVALAACVAGVLIVAAPGRDGGEGPVATAGTTGGGGPWLRLPEGWSASEASFPMAGGRATLLRAASAPVPPVADDPSVAPADAVLGPDDVLVDVLVRRPLPGRQEPAVPGRLPLRVTAADVPRRAYTGQTARVVVRRMVRIGGTVVQLRVALGPGIAPPAAGAAQDLPPDLDARLARANAVLATLVLPPGG